MELTKNRTDIVCLYTSIVKLQIVVYTDVKKWLKFTNLIYVCTSLAMSSPGYYQGWKSSKTCYEMIKTFSHTVKLIHAKDIVTDVLGT